MKIKILKSTIFLFIICAFLSCSRDDEDPSARKVLLGKWELIADGETEDNMNERNDGTYNEYLSNGAFRIWNQRSSSVYGETGGLSWTGTYKIYSDSLITYYGLSGSSDRVKDCYKYSFSDSLLKLSLLREDDCDILSFSGEGIDTYMYMARYFLFKRKN
ncbi:MAG: hypothetical protein FWD60_10495 [Candidatus Azobacteroides sp.]|nr:hypothetical protein [Candidatus Azobacteroides sp.]